jgi:hypothetical protein
MKTKSRQIAMDDIPFAPLLADTVPPVQSPPAPLPVKRPRSCRVVAWRHDGGLDNTTFGTIESATAFAKALHWAIYWKYALQCDRDMVDRQLIEAPQG